MNKLIGKSIKSIVYSLSMVVLATIMCSCNKYKHTGEYQHDLAAVQAKNGKWGYIDRSKNEVIPCVYEEAGWFRKGGYAEVSKGEGKYGIIDTNGKEIIPCKYEEISLKDALDDLPVEVKINGKYGVLDINGEEIIPIKYDHLSFYNGRIEARLGNEHVIFDNKGNELLFKEGTMKIEDINLQNNTFKLIDDGDGNQLTYKTIVMSIKKESGKLLSPPYENKEIVKVKCTSDDSGKTDMVRFVITPGAHSLADDVEYMAYPVNTKLRYELVGDELKIFID